ncbi:tape measure protein [uncultured Parabacteroides sp.]|uniref:tape measure protein n=1 Tax=uncultured Parabacteroides sp. TaxID=512312 RepID=UPI0025F3CDE7|nr:tape measure protein [uncultured Parabacteroides sp.]
MGSLGKLWFELGLKDLTDKDIKAVEKRLKDLDIQVGLNSQSLKSSIENVLRGQQFKIDVVVDKANTTKLIQDAIAKAGINTNVSASDVRAKRIEEINKRIQNSYDESREKIKKLQEQVRKLRGEYSNTSSSASKYSGSLGGITKNMRTQFNLAVQLRNQLANIYSVYAAERFLTQIIEIGGEFQKQRVALQTMFKDATKADVLFGQIKELAVVSPFEFKELAGYTKQLAAFNIPYEEMYDTTKRLADISAGVGVDMGRIILAYGQVRSAEFLKGTELRQFTEAGIPLLQKLADKFTLLEGRVVSVGEVFDKISKREVSFQMVKDVLWDLTNEGGQFYNMQGALADTLAGKLANLRDAYDVMLADIAESNNSTLGSGLDLVTDTMSNWEELSDIILTVVATYGSYKAAIMILTVAQKVYNSSLGVSGLINFLRSTQMLTRATQAQIVVQKVLNTVMKANPIILVASAIAGLIGSYTLFSNKAKETQEIITDLNESLGKLQTNFEENKGMEKLIDEYELLSNKQNKTTEESKRLETVTASLKSHFKGAAMEVNVYSGSLQLSVRKMKELNEEQKRNYEISARHSLKEANDRKQELKDKIKFLNDQIKIGSGRIHVGEATNLDDWFSFGFITDEDIADMANNVIKYEDELKRLEESSKNTKKFLDNLGKSDKNINGLKEGLKGWRKSVADFVSGNNSLKHLVPKEDDDYASWLNKLKDELSDAKDELARKEGTKGLFSEDDIKADKRRIQELQSVVDKFNISVSGKEKGKDLIAEKFQEQVRLIKEAMGTYNKYVSLLGKEGAMKAVNEDVRFAGLNFNPDKIKESLRGIQSELQKVMGNNKDRIKVNKEIEKMYTDIDLDSIKRNSSEAMEIIRRQVEESTRKWNLYKQIFDITGDKQASLKVAFGTDASSMDGINSQADHLRNVLLEKTGKTYEELSDLSENKLKEMLGDTSGIAKEIVDKIREVTKVGSEAVIQDALTMVQKYADANEKIKALENKREDMLSNLRNTDYYKSLSEAGQKTLDAGVIKEYAQQIQSLWEESIKLSPIWQKLFGDTAALGYSNMRKVVSEAKKMMDTVEEIKNPKTGESQYVLSYKDENDDIKKTTVSLETYLRLVKQVSQEERKLNEQNPFQGIKDSLDKYNKALKEGNEEEKKEALSSLGQYANDAAKMIKELTDAWSGMFDSLGNEGVSDVLSFAGDILGELGSLSQGLTSGNPIQMAASALSFIPNIVGKIAQFHDRKLDRAIKRSQLEVQKLQNAYTNLQKEIERQLGEASEKQTDEMVRNLQRQREELEKQMRAEEDKKKTDKSKIEDYKQQIEELDDQMRYFYEDLAKDLYDIDLKDWAGSIADSLVDAFASGEDAAEAFDNTVADIMKNVLKNILQTQYIETAMSSLREYLFGKDGKGGILGDGTMSSSDMSGLVTELSGLRDIIGQSQKVWEYLNEAAEKAGITLTDTTGESNKKGLSASIQGVTEDTANLLGSYLNAIRHDVSVKRNLLDNIAGTLLPTMSVTAQAQLQQLNAIAANTKANADAAIEIQKSSTVIQNALSSVIVQGKGGKAVRIQ